jgi:hypothetical protein
MAAKKMKARAKTLFQVPKIKEELKTIQSEPKDSKHEHNHNH